LPVRNIIEPPDVEVPDKPLPLIIDTRPPDCVEEDVVPAMITISPPVPLLPTPTVTYTAPPLPTVAAPEPTYSAPVFPDPDAPVLKINIPLTPLLAAFAVLNAKVPVLPKSKVEPEFIINLPPD